MIPRYQINISPVPFTFAYTYTLQESAQGTLCKAEDVDSLVKHCEGFRESAETNLRMAGENLATSIERGNEITRLREELATLKASLPEYGKPDATPTPGAPQHSEPPEGYEIAIPVLPNPFAGIKLYGWKYRVPENTWWSNCMPHTWVHEDISLYIFARPKSLTN